MAQLYRAKYVVAGFSPRSGPEAVCQRGLKPSTTDLIQDSAVLAALKSGLVFSDKTPDMKKPQVVDLNESIRRTAELAKNKIRPNRIHLDLRLSSKSPRVLAHPAELTQALLNLVSNAVDAISSVRASGTIQITSAVIRNHVLISVIGDGPASKGDARFRVSLSRDLIRQIGGDVWVSNGETSGTTFTIDLPSAALN